MMHHCIESMSLLCLIINAYPLLSMYAQGCLISSHFLSIQDRQEAGELGHTAWAYARVGSHSSRETLGKSCITLLPMLLSVFYEDFVHQHYYRYSVNTQGNLNMVVTINTAAAIPYSTLPYKMVRAPHHACSLSFLLQVLKQSPSRPHPQCSCFSPSHSC